MENKKKKHFGVLFRCVIEYEFILQGEDPREKEREGQTSERSEKNIRKQSHRVIMRFRACARA